MQSPLYTCLKECWHTMDMSIYLEKLVSIIGPAVSHADPSVGASASITGFSAKLISQTPCLDPRTWKSFEAL